MLASSQEWQAQRRHPSSHVGFVGDPSLAADQDRGRDPYLDQFLWYKFRLSDDKAQPPDPCSCHNLFLGSCPQVQSYHVERISRGLRETGLTPNMDGLRQPLRFPSFPVDTWEWALDGYFDKLKIVRSFRFGWDVSFTAEPRPKDAKWNLQGASLFQGDVQHYIDQELKFGSLVGPFDANELPFDVYCSQERL